MKKIIVLLALITFATSGSAFATALATGGVSAEAAKISGNKTGGNSSTIGSLSSKVKITVQYSPTTFAAVTKHLNGVKLYGSSSGDTKIYAKDSTAGVDVVGGDCGASDSTAFTGNNWSAL